DAHREESREDEALRGVARQQAGGGQPLRAEDDEEPGEGGPEDEPRGTQVVGEQVADDDAGGDGVGAAVDAHGAAAQHDEDRGEGGWEGGDGGEGEGAEGGGHGVRGRVVRWWGWWRR